MLRVEPIIACCLLVTLSGDSLRCIHVMRLLYFVCAIMHSRRLPVCFVRFFPHCGRSGCVNHRCTSGYDVQIMICTSDLTPSRRHLVRRNQSIKRGSEKSRNPRNTSRRRAASDKRYADHVRLEAPHAPQACCTTNWHRRHSIVIAAICRATSLRIRRLHPVISQLVDARSRLVLLNRAKQLVEVALPKSSAPWALFDLLVRGWVVRTSDALDDLDEESGAVSDGLREDLQQYALVVAVCQDAELAALCHLRWCESIRADPGDQIIIIRLSRPVHQLEAAARRVGRAHCRDGREHIVRLQGDVLHSRPSMLLQVLRRGEMGD